MLCAVTGFESKRSVHRYEIVLRYRRALVQRHLDGSPLHPELELQGEEMEPQLQEPEEEDETTYFKTGFMEKRGQVVLDTRVACLAGAGLAAKFVLFVFVCCFFLFLFFSFFDNHSLFIFLRRGGG